MAFRYNWRPDLPDHRDRIYNSEEAILSGGALPHIWDLSSRMPPIYDQGQLGSCTSQAWARLMEYRAICQGEATSTPSRLFIYYNERLIEGTVDQDSGAQVRSGARVVSTMGVPPETDWAYDISRFASTPPQAAYTDAKQHEALAYKRILPSGSGAPMRTAIHNGLPIVFGFSVPDYFETNDGWSFDQPLPLPHPDTRIVGGHAVVLSGFDFSLTRFPVPAFQVENSWGADWGLGGRFWLDYRYFSGTNPLAQDLWVVSKVS